MSQDQPFIWKSNLSGPVSWVGQTVLARLMESACQLCGSLGGRYRKGTMVSAHFDTRHFNFFLYATGAFQAATPVLELRGNESEYQQVCVWAF